MKSVFVLQHSHRLPQGADAVKLIGVYQSRAEAVESVMRLAKQPGFCDYPKIVDPKKDDDDQGFHLDEYELGQDHWTAGFVTMTD